MADVSAEIMERNNLTADDIAWLVPHQANKRIIDATANRMGVGPEKVMLNIHRYGNTTNGTIPLCLWEWEKQLHKGDNIILAAFGGRAMRSMGGILDTCHTNVTYYNPYSTTDFENFLLHWGQSQTFIS